MWQIGASQIQAQLRTELRLVNGGELRGSQNSRVSGVGHMDNRSHNQRVVVAILGDLCVALILKEMETLFNQQQRPRNVIR